LKVQTEFTFDEAKKEVVERLSVLAKFAENLHDQYLLETLEQWVIVLRTIEAEIRKASRPCLLDSEIEQIWRFGQQLIVLKPDLEPQLSQFWSLYQEVYDILRRKSSSGYDLKSVINELEPKIDSVDKLSSNIVLSAKNRISDILSPAALLLIHLIRTESIEHALRRQLEDAIIKFGLKGKYDVLAICSVHSKVQKGREWRTDVRAIRDAIAHGHFKIEMLDRDWLIEFSHNEQGYKFNQRFSCAKFLELFDLHTLLYKLQLHLFIVLELLPILATHLRKQQPNTKTSVFQAKDESS